MPSATKKRELDLSGFPTGAVTEYSTLVCLACIFDIFTKQLGLAPRTAYSEIKRHSPSAAELTAPQAMRPYFDSEEKNPHCPYCNSAKRWHARFDTYRIEGGKKTDVARRALLKSLSKAEEQFQVIEAKSDRRALLFEWLDTLGRNFDFEDDAWLVEAARAYLERVEPKTDWSQNFEGVCAVRRSSRLEEGWERDRDRLFLSSALYNDVLFVQYLVSRSHKHGGRTFEGRMTLSELVRRLRYSGHLDAQGITERDQFDVLEKLVERMTGDEGTVKLYYVVDRRDFLEKVKTVYARYATG
ncbi:MAG TPA: hypothetical protein VF779_20245 [Pyrinomonadaceae bacterium]